MRIFLTPAILDCVIFLVFFAVSYGAGERGLTMRQCAWLGGLFQLTYMLASVASGWALTRRNARALVLWSAGSSILLAAACLALRGYGPLLIAMAFFGVSSAGFFNSFQSFMRGESPPGGLMRATALYTLAWSTGSSAGFLLSGALYRLGPVVLVGLTAAIGIWVLSLLFSHRTRPHDALSAEEHTDAADHGETVNQADYVWAARIMIFMAMFTQRPLQTFFPALGGQQGVEPAWVGMPLFLHMFLQGLCGWGMVRKRHWLYRRLPLALVPGAAGLLLLALWKTGGWAADAAGIALLGAWAGFTYFCAVYYAGNSGHRSRNIGINECLVGLGSFAGLFVCEWFMKLTGSDATMYAVCAGALFLSAAAQWFVTRPRKTATPA